MSPPTIPNPSNPVAEEVARIVIAALKNRGYNAGLTDRNNILQHDFDVTIHWGNLSIGSKKKNRSWLHVTWEKRIITFNIYGRRWDAPYSDELLIVDMADPDSFNKIVDFIERISIEDKYRYPFI